MMRVLMTIGGCLVAVSALLAAQGGAPRIPAALAAMANAEVGDDVFGEDPTVRRLEERIAEMLGKPAALFVTSGTMGNQIGVRLHCQGGDEFLCDAGCHIFNYEQGAYAQLFGIAVRPIAARLETPSGRDFLRIIPQLAHALGASLRKGAPSPATAQARRILRLLDERLSYLPEDVRRERLVVFVLMISNIAANRAQLIAAGRTPRLDTPRFVQHFIDVIDSALRAPDTTARAATE